MKKSILKRVLFIFVPSVAFLLFLRAIEPRTAPVADNVSLIHCEVTVFTDWCVLGGNGAMFDVRQKKWHPIKSWDTKLSNVYHPDVRGSTRESDGTVTLRVSESLMPRRDLGARKHGMNINDGPSGGTKRCLRVSEPVYVFGIYGADNFWHAMHDGFLPLVHTIRLVEGKDSIDLSKKRRLFVAHGNLDRWLGMIGWTPGAVSDFDVVKWDDFSGAHECVVFENYVSLGLSDEASMYVTLDHPNWQDNEKTARVANSIEWVYQQSYKNRLMPQPSPMCDSSNGAHLARRRPILTFVSRSTNRIILNECEVLEVAHTMGFDVRFVRLEELDLYDQLLLFSKTCVWVAAHGASFGNLFYLPKETRVVQLYMYAVRTEHTNYMDVMSNPLSKSELSIISSEAYKDIPLPYYRGINFVTLKKIRSQAETNHLYWEMSADINLSMCFADRTDARVASPNSSFKTHRSWWVHKFMTNKRSSNFWVDIKEFTRIMIDVKKSMGFETTLGDAPEFVCPSSATREPLSDDRIEWNR